MGLWRQHASQRTTYPSPPNPVGAVSPVEPVYPRWSPHPKMPPPMTHRIEFNPGAPAFAYSLYGPLEYPVLAGYNNRFQFRSYTKPFNVYTMSKLKQGLGQSWSAQGPAPAAEQLYTPNQLQALLQAAQSGIGAY